MKTGLTSTGLLILASNFYFAMSIERQMSLSNADFFDLKELLVANRARNKYFRDTPATRRSYNQPWFPYNIKTKTYAFPVLPTHPDQSRLLHLEMLLEQFSNGHPKQPASVVSEQLLNRVRSELPKPIPDVRIVKEIEKDIKYHFEIPTWWSDVTMCFKYLPDVEGKYCTGEKLTCAKPNQYTNQFHDWSRAAGGCRLSWGIFFNRNDRSIETETISASVIQNSTASYKENFEEILANISTDSFTELPEWFRMMKLCYRYSPYCKGHIEHEIQCSGLNEFMPFYYDKYGYKDCAVAMSWGIQVPTTEVGGSIPAWALSSMICMKAFRKWYEPFLKHSSPEKTACARVNSYTAPFQDRSYFKSHIHYAENFMKWALADSWVRN